MHVTRHNMELLIQKIVIPQHVEHLLFVHLVSVDSPNVIADFWINI